MTKTLKIVFSIVAMLFVLVSGALWWANGHRAELFRWLLREVNSNINGQLTAEKLDFTPFAGGSGLVFTLTNVCLRDTAYHQHQQNLLSLRRVSIGVDVQGLFKGQFMLQSLRFEEGQIRLFRQKSGYSNSSFFSPKKSLKNGQTTANSSFSSRFLGDLKNVIFTNVAFQLDDSLNHKKIAFTLQNISNDLQKNGSNWQTHWQGGVYFEGLSFNTERGTFLAKKATQTDFNVTFEPETQMLRLDSSQIQVENDRMKLDGLFGFAGKGVLKLNVQTDSIALIRALAIVPERLAKKITKIGILPTVRAKVRLDGLLNEGGTPRLNVDFQTDTFRYETPLGLLTQIKAFGNYNNHVDSSRGTTDQNSRISITKLNGLLYGVIPYRTVFTVSDLENPQLAMNGTFETDLPRCNALFDEKYRFKAGKAVGTYRYRGGMFPIFDAKRNALNGTLRGKVIFEKADFYYAPQQLLLNGAISEVSFDEKTARVSFLHLYHQRSLIKMSGTVKGLLPFFFQSKSKVVADWAIATPALNLDWIQNIKSNPVKPKIRRKPWFSLLIDNVLARLDCKLTLVANQVQFRRFQAQQVSGRIYLNEKSVRLENIKMNAMGGSFLVSGGVDDLQAPTRRLNASGKIVGADVKKVFQSFENFGQKTINDQNLSGLLSSNFRFNTNVRRDFSILSNTMNGQLSVELSNGELTHFEPLKKLQNVLFKRRNFDEIRFATISNVFDLRGQEITIRKMTVESSVLTLFVEGIYSFRDKTDLRLQIPLSNLKRRRADYELLKHDLKNQKGANILLRAQTEDGEIKIRYDGIDWNRKKK